MKILETKIQLNKFKNYIDKNINKEKKINKESVVNKNIPYDSNREILRFATDKSQKNPKVASGPAEQLAGGRFGITLLKEDYVELPSLRVI